MTVTYNPNLSPRKRVIAQRFSKACHYDDHAIIQQQICQRLLALIITTTQQSVLEIGAGSGQLTSLLTQSLTARQWRINELCPSHADSLQRLLPAATIHIGDAELLENQGIDGLGHNHSLIISANAVQWFDDPLSFVSRSASQLQSGGQLLFSTFSPHHFHEFTALTKVGLDYPSLKQWCDRLGRYDFDLHSCDRYQRSLTFARPYDVLRHLKATGVTAAVPKISSAIPSGHNNDSSQIANPNKAANLSSTTAKPFWNKHKLEQFDQQYRQHFALANGQVSLTYDALLISAVKR